MILLFIRLLYKRSLVYCNQSIYLLKSIKIFPGQGQSDAAHACRELRICRVLQEADHPARHEPQRERQFWTDLPTPLRFQRVSTLSIRLNS